MLGELGGSVTRCFQLVLGFLLSFRQKEARGRYEMLHVVTVLLLMAFLMFPDRLEMRALDTL